MKKRIYILLPLLLIMLIMGVDRVQGFEYFIDGAFTTGGGSVSCSTYLCSGDAYPSTDGSFHGYFYGLRIKLVDENGNTKSAPVNFWRGDLQKDSHAIISDIKDVNGEKLLYFYDNIYRVSEYKNIVSDLIPSGLGENEQQQVSFSETLNNYDSDDLKRIVSILTNTAQEQIDWNEYANYYLIFEPIFVQRVSNYQKHYFMYGTIRENYASFCQVNESVLKPEDNIKDGRPLCYWFAHAADSGNMWVTQWSIYDNYLMGLYIENSYINLSLPLAPSKPHQNADLRFDNYNNGSLGYALGVITLKDKIKDTEPRWNQLKINKYEGIPSDNNNRFNGSAIFRIDKCTDDTSCEINDDNDWKTIFTNNEQNDWSTELTITRSNTDLAEGKEYRIKEMGSNPSAKRVYYKFGDELQQIKDGDGDGWFKFTYSKDHNVINVYNVSSGIQEECKDEVYNITNNNGLNLAQKHYFLYKLFEDTYTDNNNLVAFDVFKDEIEKGFESADKAGEMCKSSNKESTPNLSCSGEFELGTRIKNNLYPNKNNLKYIILNDDSLKLYVDDSNLYCATSYTMSNDFKEEKVKAGDLLWKEAPGHLTEKITCYGFVKDNNFKLNEEDLKKSLIDKLNNVDYGELPSISMKITTPTDSDSNSITEFEELKLEIIGNRQKPVFEKFKSTDFSVNGQNYKEIRFTARISDGDMKYDKLCYPVDGEIGGTCDYRHDDSGNGTPGFAISFEEEFIKGQDKKRGEGTLELSYNGKTYEEKCAYYITPGPITTHEENSYEYNFEVRTIDTNNPFPGINGKDGEGRTVGSNWCTYDYIGKDIDGIKVGDINGDGKIVNSDVLNLNMILNSDSEEVKYADFNGDGITNNDDSSILQNYVEKLEKDFNCKNQGYLIQKYIKDRHNSNSTEAPMYTFTLKSNDIKKIREYNKDHNYNSFVPDKNNKLLSQFITDALNGTLTTNSLDYGREYTCKDNRGNEGC